MKEIYTVIETANELGVSTYDVYELIRDNRLQGIKIGSLKIPKNELLRIKDIDVKSIE
ncbi:MAG: helix-turn-helix domain-containing protein [Clostridium sp.]|nr:helix-turn-helix domain-containing protein [Clostridium sp.]